MIAGTIGGGGKLEFTLIGDTVNVAARVEQLTKTTGDAILLTHQTVDALASRPRRTHRPGIARAERQVGRRAGLRPRPCKDSLMFPSSPTDYGHRGEAGRGRGVFRLGPKFLNLVILRASLAEGIRCQWNWASR